MKSTKEIIEQMEEALASKKKRTEKQKKERKKEGKKERKQADLVQSMFAH